VIDDGHYVTDLHATVLHLPGLDNRRLKIPAAEASTLGLSFTKVLFGQDLESKWLAIISPAAE
jgi:hypothetical protein